MIFNSISLQPGIKGITGLRHQIAKICKFEHVIVNKVGALHLKPYLQTVQGVCEISDRFKGFMQTVSYIEMIKE